MEPRHVKALLVVSLISVNLLTVAMGDADVFIIGGTGDLARRYLWKGFFDLFRRHPRDNIKFYGAGRVELQDNDTEKVKFTPFQRILLQSLSCGDSLACQEDLKRFILKAQYIVLKTQDHYKEMCTMIKGAEGDVIFYLSVPPAAYKSIVKMIVGQCGIKPNYDGIKFVFEKPFGTDLESAINLSSMLEGFLNESQIYRVDHYLGKNTPNTILEFRKDNTELEQLMNRDCVKKIEVTVSETSGCKGRATYYDQSGAIRDMIQSHLTEILCLITMDTFLDKAKLHLLRNITTVQLDHVSLGQYEGYPNDVADETGIRNSKTSTFASAKIHISDSRWHGVPIVASSGKHMNERSGFGRVIFKTKHSTKSCEIEGCQRDVSQIVFIIRHEILQSPAILVSRHLPVSDDYTPSGWMKTFKFDDKLLFGSKGKRFRIYVPEAQEDAYSYLIGRLHQGDKKLFLPMDSLLESWRIWSPAVKEADRADQFTVYRRGSSLQAILELCSQKLLSKCVVSNIYFMRCDTV